MKTLTAQRLKKQAENEYKNRGEMIEHILEQAQAEVEKLETLLTVPEDISPRKDVRVVVAEYREDDEASYFEQGVMER
jgi:hypothetical protein